MIKGAEIDYQSYAKSMRGVLSGPQICLPDNTLNHQYFNAKKGFYWSEGNQITLIDGIKALGKDWKKIAAQFFHDTKSEVELQMRACLLFKVKDAADINEKQITTVEKRIKSTSVNGIVNETNKQAPTKNGNSKSKKKL